MTIRLEGLRPKPLSRYLCALGMLRLLGEQHKADVTGCWRGEAFEIDGLSRDEFDDFFVNCYAPTPVFSPWNKEGDPEQNATTRSQLDQIEAAEGSRLDPYRETLASFRTLSQEPAWGPADKEQRLKIWRSRAPDAALAWLDGAAALTGDGPAFSPLLGTGGNDGRLEISRLFQREAVRLVVDRRQSKSSAGWFTALCDGAGGPPLVDSTLGQFDADAAGGINSGSVASVSSASNPWAIVLTIEGCLAMAAAASSRLGFSRSSVMAVPFFVRSSAVGPDDSESEDSRGELWAPLWDRPTTWPELRLQLGEGRLQWHGRRAASTVDAARAIGSLGTSRGIAAFERFGMVNRNGKSFVAVPRGRVRAKPLVGVPLLAPLDDWLRRIPRGDRVPGAVEAAAGAVDRGQLTVVTSEGVPSSFLELLIAVARLEQAVRRSGSVRDRIRPLPRQIDVGGEWEPLLPADQWLSVMDDGSPELRIAAGLASLRDTETSANEDRSASEREAALAVRQITAVPKERWLCWPGNPKAEDPAVLAFRQAPQATFLTLLSRRIHDAVGTQSEVETSGASPLVAPFEWGLKVRLKDLTALLDGRLDVARIRDLIAAFALLNFTRSTPDWTSQSDNPAPVPPWFALVRLCLHDRPLQIERDGATSQVWVFADRSWGRLMRSGRFHEVAGGAAARLRRLGLTPLLGAAAPHATTDPETLAMALMCRLHGGDLRTLREAADPFAIERHGAGTTSSSTLLEPTTTTR